MNVQQMRAARVLCVNHDSYLADLLRYALTREGYAVQLAHTGRIALEAVQSQAPDLVLLDADLPDAGGLDLCAHIRRQYRLPVIMLSSRRSDEDILAGLERGADDYVVKPFSMRVLMARVAAVRRRAQPASAASGVRRFYRLHTGWFDADQRQVTANGATAKLTPTESNILQLLLANEGRVFSAERMLDELWDYEADTCMFVIKTHIRYLRAKLATVFGATPIIHTFRGQGYAIRLDARDHEQAPPGGAGQIPSPADGLRCAGL